MKWLLPLAFLLFFAHSVHGQTCDKSLMAHVYHPDRLVVQQECITVKGTVTFKKPEDDGDYHYRLKLAPGQPAGLVNSKNIGGLLVFEPICVHGVKSPSANKAACKSFHQGVTLPNKGDKVSVTGTLMVDTKHCWLELHPVTSITVLP
jgi:hypothetical protein